MAASFVGFRTGSAGADTLIGDQFGAPVDDTIFGLGSGDSIQGLGADDILFGGFGDDTVQGNDGSDSIEGGAGADSLSGGNGRDLLSYAQSSLAVDVNLATGAAAGGDAAGDVFTGFEDLHGTLANDTLAGSNGRNGIAGGFGNDVIRGRGGNDTLRGDAGEDTLRGDAGDDVFLYFDATDSSVATADEILDFVQGDDLIDLSAIDANAATAVDDAFTFIFGAFTGVAGQLRDAGIRLEGDTDGDGVADFAIEVFSAGGGVVLTAGDIVL